MKIIIALSILLSFSCQAFTVKDRLKAPNRLSAVKNILKSYKKRDFEKDLRALSAASTFSRFVGTPGHSGARSFIIDHIKKGQGAGEVLFVDDFTPDIDGAVEQYQNDFKTRVEGKVSKDDKVYGLWQRFTNSMIKTLRSTSKVTGKNIVWEKKGSVSPKKVLLIGAHYDTLVINKKTFEVDPKAEMPGADNNLSGVVVGLSLIRVLQELNLPITVRVVFFDFEELGMIGSKSFIKKHISGINLNEQILGFINLRMLGHDTKMSDRKKRKGNMSIYIRDDKADKAMAEEFVARGKKITSSVKFSIVPNSYDNSSHANFWKVGISSLLFSHDMENDSNELRTYTSNDFIETLNLSTLYNSFTYISAGVIGKAFGISK